MIPIELTIAALIFIVSLVVLVKSSDALVDSAANIACSLGIREFIIGIIVIGFGTSLPELTASIFASISGVGGIAAGNVIGSNITNIFLVIGLISLFGAIYSTWEQKRRDVYIMLLLSAGIFGLALDGSYSKTDGFILLLLMIISVYVIVTESKGAYKMNKCNLKKHDAIITILSLAGVIISARFFISSASKIAILLGISDYAIGLSIVALGTSLPELFTSFAAIRKRLHGMVIGNIVGSNIFNIGLVLGVASLIKPISVSSNILWIHLPIMLAAAVILSGFIKLGKVPKHAGYILLPAYALFICLSYIFV